MGSLAVSSLVDRVCHSANLATAFRRYRRYRGTWSRGIPMAEAEADPVERMLALAEDLHGDYCPHPPAVLRIAKCDGSQRELSVYPVRDRVAQRAALQVLQAETDPAMADCSYGFRPGRGVNQAVAAVRQWIDDGYLWVVDADIERCFDSIPREPLLEAVAARAGADAAMLVQRLMGWKQTKGETGIPQGAPLSPWLCNVYLWSLDEALAEARIPLARYADDFVAMAPAEVAANAALALCRETLGRLRLRLHPVKTRLLSANAPFRFLGQWLGATTQAACAGGPELVPCG